MAIMALSFPKLWLIVRDFLPLASKLPAEPATTSTCSKRFITLVTAEERDEIAELNTVESEVSPEPIEETSELRAVEMDASAF